jgi:hypothetical protein
MVPDASIYDIDHLDHSLLMDIKYLLLYGVISSKHKLQQCSTKHLLHYEGVVQIVAKEEEEDRGRGLIQGHTLREDSTLAHDMKNHMYSCQPCLWLLFVCGF